MSAFANIDIVEKSYQDKDYLNFSSRENLIQTILEIEERLGTNEYSRLGLRTFYNDQLRGIVMRLKGKLKIYKLINLKENNESMKR